MLRPGWAAGSARFSCWTRTRCSRCPPAPAAPGPGAMTARLRYQQTKIDGAPDTILVDAEIVAIIRAWRNGPSPGCGEHAAPGVRSRYLFLGLLFNRNADRPYVLATLHKALTELARRLDIRDSAGQPVDFRRTHRFRHTRATSLQVSGVAAAASFSRSGERALLLCSVPPWGTLGATRTQAPCVTWDVIIRLHQTGP